jgi:hypothetical protein
MFMDTIQATMKAFFLLLVLRKKEWVDTGGVPVKPHARLARRIPKGGAPLSLTLSISVSA